MGNAEETKEHLLKIAGNLFNTQGYKSTSLSDITFASGFSKGAIYKHFENKATLEKEALVYMTKIILHDLRRRIKAESSAVDKMMSVFHYYSSYITDPIIPGGCPLLNAATEVDDTLPELRHVANQMMDTIHESIVTILKNGIKYEQLKPVFDVEDIATLIVSSFEGAIMMSKLSGNNNYLKQVFKHLEQLLKSYSY